MHMPACQWSTGLWSSATAGGLLSHRGKQTPHWRSCLGIQHHYSPPDFRRKHFLMFHSPVRRLSMLSRRWSQLVQTVYQGNLLNLSASKCKIVVFDKSSTKTYDERLKFEGNSFQWRKRWNALATSGNRTYPRYQWLKIGLESEESLLPIWQCLCFPGQSEPGPVSSCLIVQCCVLPILLYGVENWIISWESIKKLECLQGKITKILQMPKWYFNKAACIAFSWNSIH